QRQEEQFADRAGGERLADDRARQIEELLHQDDRRVEREPENGRADHFFEDVAGQDLHSLPNFTWQQPRQPCRFWFSSGSDKIDYVKFTVILRAQRGEGPVGSCDTDPSPSSRLRMTAYPTAASCIDILVFALNATSMTSAST